MAAGNFPVALAMTLAHEGGWSDHPADPGGATMKGITIATFRSWRGDNRATPEMLRAIGDDEVAAIYRDLYWNAVRGDDLPGGVDLAVFDMAVNAGVSRSARQLQMAANEWVDLPTQLAVDGIIGPRTLAAVAQQHPAVIVARLMAHHGGHYRGLTTFGTFGRGWMRRLDRRLIEAIELIYAGRN